VIKHYTMRILGGWASAPRTHKRGTRWRQWSPSGLCLGPLQMWEMRIVYRTWETS